MDALLNALKISIHASLRAEEIAHIGPVPITNSNLMAWAAMLVLIVFGYAAGRNPKLVPTGVQNVVEAIIEALLTIVENTAGHYARRVFPLIATFFIFIITANYMGLLPGVGTITVRNPAVASQAAVGGATAHLGEPGGQSVSGVTEEHEPETVPLFRSADADVNMTLGMALIAFAFIHISGIAVHGVGGYWKELSTPLLMTPIKLVIELFVPVSLSMRLFGNIFGGEMLLTVMGFPFVAIPFMGMELLFGLIQAIIFTMLSLIFVSLAVYVPPGHGDHDHRPGDQERERHNDSHVSDSAVQLAHA